MTFDNSYNPLNVRMAAEKYQHTARRLRENPKSPQKPRSKTPHFVTVISRCGDLGSCAWGVCRGGALVGRRWH